ncbi:hypothetical protein KP509_36G004200 [Ceratopteris richardii]|nr:hypothetical protein KP509_36G004200 [Ceratopteris richardii]
MEINNFYSGPPQVPHYNYVHYPRAGVFYSFYYNHDNSTTPFAIGNEHPVRLHCSQDYGYVNFTHTGCVHPHDPSVTQPVSSMVSPSLQMNTIDYNHPSFQGLSPCGVHYEAPYNDSTMLPSEAMTYMHALSLQKRVQNQIEYYFSDENLCKDKFLISKMDDEGYVPVSLIASFPKIKEKTSNTTLVLESMKNSTLVEVKNDKLRRYNWEWVKTMLLGLSKIQLDVSGNWSERGNGKSKASFKEGQFDSGSSLLEGRMVENSLLKQIQAKLSV